MVRLIGGVLAWLRGGALKLLILAAFILLVWGIFAPVGTLVWWLGQGAESLGWKRNFPRQLPGDRPVPPISKARTINCYIVFLSGVGDFSANQLTPGEEWFLDRLVSFHPNCVAVRDVFPYSAANQSLGGQRLLAPLWRAAEEADGWLKNADILIKIRNLWRFAISADGRYGTIYNQGIANAIIDRMEAAHPIPRSNTPVNLILIGTSGGAQVGLGAAPYLKQWLKARITMVSIGGVFDGATGFEAVDRVYHLQGQRDWVEDISSVVFATRWPITVGSPFVQAQQQGRYQVVQSGPQAHDGDQGYFGQAIARSGKSYVALTLQQVNQLPIWAPSKTKGK